jgi:phosphoserine phosphatase
MTSALYVATLVAPVGVVLSAAQIEAVIQRIIQNGGHVEKTVWLDESRAADIFFLGKPIATLDLPFDTLIQPAATRQKKILIADMESTIIEQEMLDELAARIGVGEQTASITRRAMNGELDFGLALAERVRLLKGQPESLLHEVAATMTLMPGAERLLGAMRRTGGKSWLVSGGFTFFVKIIAEHLGFDRYYANELGVENGLITGETALPILGKETKRELLEKACAEYGYRLADCLSVGDGANDVPMLEACNAGGGLGVAYHAKPRVREVIPNQINICDLSALVYAQNLIG